MKKKKLLSVLVAAALSLSCFTAVPIVSQAAASTSSETENEVYIRAAGFAPNCDGVTNVAQFKGPDGKLCYAINSDDFVTVYKTSGGEPVSGTVTLKKQHPIFGTALCDSDGNFYLVTGEINTTDDMLFETVFVSKYDSNGKHIKTTGDTGTDSPSSYATKIPFNAGNCDAAIFGKFLTVHYAKKMINGHQSCSTFMVNIDDMSKVGMFRFGQSHSFAQRVVPTQEGFVYMSEGDAIARAFAMHSIKLSGDSYAIGRLIEPTFDFWVEDGADDRDDMYVLNNNFARMGGLAVLSNGNVAFAAQSAQSLNSNAALESQEIFLQIFDPYKSLQEASSYVTVGERSGLAGSNGRTPVTNYGVKWLTSYGKGSRIENVQIASTDKKEIVVLYEYYENSYKGVYYIVLDENGNVTCPATLFDATARLNPCEMPVYSEGKIRWVGNKYYGDRIYIYSLDLPTKVAEIVKEPSAVTGLVYNGTKQALVTEGSATGGMMQYALCTDAKPAPGADKFSTSIPTAKDAGTYYVWYKVIGDDTHKDSETNCLVVTIKGDNGTDPVETLEMYRLYNPNSGEHFYTGKVKEKNNLVKEGWRYEGVAWNAPRSSDTPVYRLYNPNAGDHHYTMSEKEKDNLIAEGWNYEGIGWYSAETKDVPLFRLYNSNTLSSGAHHYTINPAERDHLVEVGWKDEGVSWYGM